LENKDIKLWQAFKNGDKEAFAQIYNLFIADLLSYGYRVTSDQSLIRDSVQDIFLNLWQTRSNLSDTDSIRFYLYRSLRNKIVRNMEKSNKNLDPSYLFENIIGTLSIEEDIICSEKLSEQLNKLKKSIQGLPKRQQEIIQLKYYHDFSIEEIAKIMQINNQSVRNLLHRTISELRQYFSILLGMIIALLV
jgi:RNA polymerase sigma factor (sigma-70 family)